MQNECRLTDVRWRLLIFFFRLMYFLSPFFHDHHVPTIFEEVLVCFLVLF